MEFKLRPWAISDLESLVHYANNWKVAKNLTDKFPHPYTKQNGEAFIQYTTEHNPVQIFAIEVQGKAIGGIGIHPQDDIHKKNAELGYWIAEPFWGHGIISGAINEITDYAFQNFDIDRLFARPFGTNIASQKALEKNNFILEGRFKNTIIKNGIYLDELIYAIRRKDWKHIKDALNAD